MGSQPEFDFGRPELEELIRSKWIEIREFLGSIAMTTNNLVGDAVTVEVSNGIIIVTLPHTMSYQVEMLNQPRRQNEFMEAVSAVLGRRGLVNVKFIGE